MEYITVHAVSEEQALQTAAQRYNVERDSLECRPVLEAPEPAPATPGPAPAEGEIPTAVPGPPPPPAIGEGPLAFRLRVRPQFWEQEARAWVQGFMKCFGVLTEVRVQTIGTQVFVRLSCPEPSILIGRQGHTLEALQHVVTRALSTRWPEFPEVVVDVEAYKEKKLYRLEQMARKAAQRALRLGKPQDLEPMTASERKYIHNALKDIKDIRTISHGREPNRHVVVEPLDPNPHPDAYVEDVPHRGGRGDRGDRGNHRDRGPRRHPGGRRMDRPPMREPRRPAPAAPAGQAAPSINEQETVDESLDWRPTFFKPPEETTVNPNEPYPDVEDDLHS